MMYWFSHLPQPQCIGNVQARTDFSVCITCHDLQGVQVVPLGGAGHSPLFKVEENLTSDRFIK